MFSSHEVLEEDSAQGDEGEWDCILSQVHNHFHCLKSIEL